MKIMEIREGYFELKTELSEIPSARGISEELLDGAALTAAQRTYPDLEAWAKQYPVVMPQRLVSMCLDNAAMCPQSPPRTIFQAAVVCLIIFAIDDLVDGSIDALTDQEADALLEHYITVTRSGGQGEIAPPHLVSLMRSGEPSAPWIQIARAHSALCNELATAPESAYSIFAEYFVACMEEMRTELVWRRDFIEHDRVPEWKDYIYAGERSLGAPAVWGSVIPLDGYPITMRFATEQYTSLKALCDAIVFAGGRCLRLANDARSFRREIHFEKKPNSILVLMRHESMTEKDAEALIQKRREEYFAELLRLIELLPPAMEEWGQAVRRFCEFTKAWYIMTELHDAPDEMKRLLNVISAPGRPSPT